MSEIPAPFTGDIREEEARNLLRKAIVRDGSKFDVTCNYDLPDWTVSINGTNVAMGIYAFASFAAHMAIKRGL